MPVVLGLLALSSYAVGRQAAETSHVRIGIMQFQPPDGVRGAGGRPSIAESILEYRAALTGPSSAIVGPTTTEAYDGTSTVVGLIKTFALITRFFWAPAAC